MHNAGEVEHRPITIWKIVEYDRKGGYGRWKEEYGNKSTVVKSGRRAEGNTW